MDCSDNDIQDLFQSPKDKNFYFVNSHGYEKDKYYTIPENVRIIMFCYSGRSLSVCEKFDRFNWKNIMIDPKSTKNYCSFLSTLIQYSTIRDHFCVYNSGDKIKDLILYTKKEDNFRVGLYELPAKGYAIDPIDNMVVISSNADMSDVLNDKELYNFVKRQGLYIKSDDKMLSKVLKDKRTVSIMKSWVGRINDRENLSDMIEMIKQKTGGFTAILMVCRDAVEEDIYVSKGRTVLQEYNKMERAIKIRKM